MCYNLDQHIDLTDNICMQKTNDLILNELLHLSHNLGADANDYVIVGEGNTSAQVIIESRRWNHRSTDSGMGRKDWRSKLGTLWG